jgi:acyl-CoA synthetase (AMP-forming)/AMP-acid ligase II
MELLDRLGLVLGRDPNLGTVFERLAMAFGDRPLVEQAADEPSGGQAQRSGVQALTLTYRQAAVEVGRLAASIAAGAEPGDRVVVAVPNGYRFLLLCMAASRAGCVAVPVNPQMTESEIKHVIGDCGATLVIRTEADLPRRRGLPPARPVQPDDVAALFYTSGTTGKPKGVRLTHRALTGTIRGVGLPRWIRADEAVLGLPVAHIYGFIAYLGLAAFGIPAYVLPRFRPVDALDAIEKRRASVFLGVPAMYRLLLEAGADTRDLSCVRIWISGADAMPADLARRFQKLGASASLPLVHGIGDALFAEGYGMVELGGAVAVKVHPPLVGRLLDVGMGVPLPGWEMKVEAPRGQVGELLVRGPGTMKGYHGAPEATAAVLVEDGWVRTGDLARSGPLGTVAFVGRAKDVIKNGGYSVYAIEVERALEEHPAVAEAAVLGMPDERKGERVVAVVRLREGETLAEGELLASARERLSAYKVPQEVQVVDELPRTGTEKVQKAKLRELFA